MGRRFAEIAFTDAVRDAQVRNGARTMNARFEEPHVDARAALGAAEREFLEMRDTFFMASVGTNGWPYVQHRGGEAGFVRVLDPQHIAFADLRGNRQYISVGNLEADGRVCMIFVDFAERMRLKIWARIEVVNRPEANDLLEKIVGAKERGHAERVLIATVEAFDWNCPKHIIPRYTVAEIEAASASMHAEILALKAENGRLKESLGAMRKTGARQPG